MALAVEGGEPRTDSERRELQKQTRLPQGDRGSQEHRQQHSGYREVSLDGIEMEECHQDCNGIALSEAQAGGYGTRDQE